MPPAVQLALDGELVWVGTSGDLRGREVDVVDVGCLDWEACALFVRHD